MSTPLLIAGTYTALIVVLGLFVSRRTKSNDADYYLASRSAKGWVGALSASSSSESAWALMGLVGAAYVGGVSVFWLIPGCVLGYAFNWWVVAPRVRRASQRHDVTNISEAIAKETNSAQFGFLLSAVIVVFLIVYLAAQFLAVGRVLSSLSELPQLGGVVLSAVLISLYISLGGMRASLITDIIQSILMIGAVIIIPLIAYFAIDFSATPTLPENYYDPFGNAAGFGIVGLVLGWAGIGLAYPGQPQVLQRFMAMEDDRQIRNGRWIAITWSAVVFSGAICAGLVGRHLINPEDNELVLIELANSFAHPLIGGLAMAAIFAAIASTADSQLIAISSHAKSEWLKVLGWAQISPKLVTVSIAVIAAIVAALNNSTIFSLVLFAWEFLGVTIGIAVLGTFVFKISPLQSLIALSSSALLLMLWRSSTQLSGVLYALLPAFLLGLALCAIFWGAARARNEASN